MRPFVAPSLLALIAACGINPAFKLGDGSADASGDGSEASAPITTSTGLATTTATTSSTTTGPADTTTSGETTTAATSTTDDTTDKDPACPERPDLIACYTFTDFGDELLRDAAGNIPDGKIVGVEYVPSLDAEFGDAVQLASESRIDVADVPRLNPEQFTLVLYAYLVANPGSQTLVDKNLQYSLVQTGTQLQCSVVNAMGAVSTATAFVDLETWLHVSCAFDGDEIRLDARSGAELQLGTQKLAGPLAPTSSASIAIGRDLPGDGTPMLGRIDHLLYFDRGLTADESCMLAGPLCGG